MWQLLWYFNVGVLIVEWNLIVKSEMSSFLVRVSLCVFAHGGSDITACLFMFIQWRCRRTVEGLVLNFQPRDIGLNAMFACRYWRWMFPFPPSVYFCLSARRQSVLFGAVCLHAAWHAQNLSSTLSDLHWSPQGQFTLSCGWRTDAASSVRAAVAVRKNA